MEKKCEDKHKPINEKVESIYSFLFGKTDKTDEISFASKVNLMFKDISDIKKWFSTSIISMMIFVAGGCVFFGRQLQIIEDNSKNIKELDEKVSKIEVIIGSPQDTDVDIKQVGNIRTVKIKK